jgi:hypothetical protein
MFWPHFDPSFHFPHSLRLLRLDAGWYPQRIQALPTALPSTYSDIIIQLAPSFLPETGLIKFLPLAVLTMDLAVVLGYTGYS